MCCYLPCLYNLFVQISIFVSDYLRHLCLCLTIESEMKSEKNTSIQIIFSLNFQLENKSPYVALLSQIYFFIGRKK